MLLFSGNFPFVYMSLFQSFNEFIMERLRFYYDYEIRYLDTPNYFYRIFLRTMYWRIMNLVAVGKLTTGFLKSLAIKQAIYYTR
jgi:hypothetical protein